MACTISAAEIKRVKALGFLNNKGTDLFNARVITVNGKITAQQTAVLAQAAEKFGSGEVEFTTRLTVEIRGVHFDDIPAFQEFIAPAGLITGGTGSLVRPVVSCKGTTCQYGLYDTFALSEKIHQQFYLGYHSVKLPHKFKIACGGCPNNCVKPTLNDLGIIGQLVPNVDPDSCNGCKKCQIVNTCPMQAAKLEDGEDGGNSTLFQGLQQEVQIAEVPVEALQMHHIRPDPVNPIQKMPGGPDAAAIGQPRNPGCKPLGPAVPAGANPGHMGICAQRPPAVKHGGAVPSGQKGLMQVPGDVAGASHAVDAVDLQNVHGISSKPVSRARQRWPCLASGGGSRR